MGLLYMGARHYDPEIGGFLTFDPAAQYPSPYTYGGHDPFGGSDPDGTTFVEVVISAAVVGAMSAAATMVDTLVRGGDLGTALKAGAGTFAMSAGAAPQGLVVGLLSKVPILGPALIGASLAYQGYNVVEGAKDGNIATAILGAVLLADGVYTLDEDNTGLVDHLLGRGGNPSGGASVGDTLDPPAETSTVTGRFESPLVAPGAPLVLAMGPYGPLDCQDCLVGGGGGGIGAAPIAGQTGNIGLGAGRGSSGGGSAGAARVGSRGAGDLGTIFVDCQGQRDTNPEKAAASLGHRMGVSFRHETPRESRLESESTDRTTLRLIHICVHRRHTVMFPV